MSTFKRCISLLLVLCLLLSAAPVTVHAVSSGTCGENVTWTLSDDGVLTISGTGAMYDFEYGCTPWHYNKSDIISVEIGDSVTTIGDYAFDDCNNLSSVVIGNSVTIIGDWAFAYCDTLGSVEIPDSVTSIGDSAFDSCVSLSSVEIPGSVTTIGGWAFALCYSLSGIYVDQNNFYYSSDDCGVLFDKQKSTLIQAPGAISGSYTIPDSVTTIGEGAFSWCVSLSSVEIPDSVTTIGDWAFSFWYSLSSVEIPDSVTAIGDWAFYDSDSLNSVEIGNGVITIGELAFHNCDSLSSVKFRGDAPIFGGANNVFSDVTATAYYPANNPTWTADVMQDYGGNLTWVPYTSGEIDPPDTHDTLNELTDKDYMAFSVIAYKELGPDDATVQECLTENGYWKKTWNKTFGITYEQLCKNIANWKFTDASDKSSFNGFYAAVFTNDQGEAVIAYRGSKPLTSVENATSWDAYCDWLLNDIPLELFNNMGPQLSSATGIYEDVIEMGYTPDKIAMTGHSLGGAWADTLSAYSGSRATTFNAVSILDVLYMKQPKKMSQNFAGVDAWAFVDHTNEHDILAGMFEHYFSTEIKPYVAHNSNVIIDVNFIGSIVGSIAGALVPGPGGVVVGGIVGSVTDDIIACHGMESFVYENADGDVELGGEVSRFKPNKKITNYMTMSRFHSVDLGTSSGDTINEAMTVLVSRTSYGGAGDDNINTSVRGDTIIGGPDNYGDDLDGSWGDDTYIYWIGDGYDKIWDISGEDTLKIYGAPAGSKVTSKINYNTDMVDIYCNDQLITSIYRKNRHNTKNKFVVSCNGETKNITNDLIVAKFGSSVRIACPVHVEVLNPDGNVVYTLTDGEVGTWYTEYGNFYVVQEENGEYGKVLDLVEGYTARVVGTDEGTMDVTYQVPVDGELTEPVSVSDVPVTEDVIATIEEAEDGEVYLIVDEDGDGETDYEEKLCAESAPIDPGLVYEVYENHVEITGYTGDATELVIPAQIEGLPVTTIGEEAFESCYDLISVAIPNGVTTIGKAAFRFCGNLTTVSLPNSLTTIGDSAFSACYDMANINIPSNVTYIGSSAFSTCGSLTSISIPSGVTAIRDYTFYACDGLTSITIPDSITSIGTYAFAYSSGLTSIRIPKSVTSIGIAAFAGCDNLTGIHVDAQNPNYSSDASGVLFNKEKTQLIQAPGTITDSYQIPDSVAEIGDCAFSGCENLVNFSIPEGVASIGDEAFDRCYSLASISFPDTLTWIGNSAFNSCRDLSSICIPGSVTCINYNAFADCTGLESIFFRGDAPKFGENYDEDDYYFDDYYNESNVFEGVVATAYYPAGNPSWTEKVMRNYGGTITWVPYNPDNPFLDVPVGSFYEEPVLWALKYGITTGATATTFNPNGQCLRAQVVTFLWRAAGCPVPFDTDNPFADVKSSDFFYQPVLWAVDKGITNGVSATAFGSYANCNRAAVVTFLWRAAGSPEPQSNSHPFVDVKTTDFFYKPVLWAVEKGITNGVDATHFGPTANCNRAQVVTFLYRAYN